MQIRRSAWLVWIGILWLALVPQATAQMQPSPTLLEIIQRQGDLSTFSAFVAASYEEIPSLLNSDGSYTVFAPNNTAFANLASLLGVPLGELLQKPEVISQLVRYHILADENTSAQLSTLDGSVVPTLLPNAFVAVRLREDGVLTLNNVVSIVTPDINARNGTLHIVDDVLLNRVVVETLNNPAAEEAITPNPTPVPPTTAPTPTPLRVGQIPSAGYVRFVNLLPGDDPIEVTFAEQPGFSLPPNTVTDFLLIPAGTYPLESGNGETIPVQVMPANFQTVILLENDSTRTVVEDYSAVATGESRVALFNGLAQEVGATVFEDGLPLLTTFPAQSLALLDLPGGAFDPVFNLQDDSIRLDEPLLLPEAGYTFIALYGGIGQPQLLADTIAAETITALQAELQRAATDEPLPSLAQILEETPDFSFLAESIAVLPDSLRERITGSAGEPLTLLAPTDEAFDDFLAIVNLSRADLLNQPGLLRDILYYHMLNDEIYAADFQAARGTSVVTLLSPDEAFFVTESPDGRLLLNNLVGFTQTDIPASNGLLHIIDDVLLPRRVVEALGL